MKLDEINGFDQLGLRTQILTVLEKLSFETPTEVQARAIPPMIAGHDVIAQAQTGTGKTAAFALPVLQNINLKLKQAQCLVLAPTRELAMQVAAAFRQFGKGNKLFKVTAIYGGDDYTRQLRELNDGAQVVVGTPGRVMDHMRRGSLKLDALSHLVLDEADEMLRMGFIDDVEWILSQAPEKKQSALFSATMPQHIKKIAKRYLQNAKEIIVKQKNVTVASIRQRMLVVKGRDKFDVLARIMQGETHDGVIIFTRTRSSTVDVSERLRKIGFKADALSGDIAQAARKRTVDRLKSGAIDIIVATDVAARGLDIKRVSCVINYDMPFDNETYVHRIGRTGRAGREGDAILFVTPNEQRLLKNLERMIKTKIEKMIPPSIEAINKKRVELFKQRITMVATKKDISFYKKLIVEYADASDLDIMDIAAALAHMSNASQPLLIKDAPKSSDKLGKSAKERNERSEKRSRDRSSRREDRRSRDKGKQTRGDKRTHEKRIPDADMESYRLEVGRADGVRPANIVGAIASEAGLDSAHIGQIQIKDKHSVVDLPIGMPKNIFKILKKTWVCGKKINLSRVASD